MTAPNGSYPVTAQQLREALPRYVSNWAREVASEAIDDMEDEDGEARAYYLARWFDAMRAVAQAGEPSPCAWTGYLPDEYGNMHRCWGFYHPPEDAKDVRLLYSFAPQPVPVAQGAAPANCDWPDAPFTLFLDEPGEHDPCYIVMPDGAMLSLNHHATPGVDVARAKFIVDACNAAMASTQDAASQTPMVADIAQIILSGHANGKTRFEIAEDIVREFSLSRPDRESEAICIEEKKS
jgi:hypothetical protein